MGQVTVIRLPPVSGWRFIQESNVLWHIMHPSENKTRCGKEVEEFDDCPQAIEIDAVFLCMSCLEHTPVPLFYANVFN